MQFPEKKLRIPESIRIKLHASRVVHNISTCAGDAGLTGEKRITSSSLPIYYSTFQPQCQAENSYKKHFFLPKMQKKSMQILSFHDSLKERESSRRNTYG